jgi:hypothetical protein
MVYWSVKVWEETNQETLGWSWRKLFGQEEKCTADTTEEAVEEKVENHVPILKHISGCERTNNELTNQDKEQQLADKTVDLLAMLMMTI